MLRLPSFGRRGNGTANPLDRVPLLALLEPELRKTIRKRLHRRRIGAGKLLFRQAESADALFLVESGRFRVFIGERANQERVLRFVGAGDVIGEAAFMAETPHVTSAVAVDDATVWALPRADFDALLANHKGVLGYLAAVIAERQAQANARLAVDTAPEEARGLRGYVTSVYSPRGGAGVTTLALNVSLALAELHPDDAVLLDLDVLFGHTLANLWLEPRGLLAQVAPVTLRNLDRPGLDFYLLRHASSLRIFPAALRPDEGQTITSDHVRAALGTLRRYFGHVVLDLPHGFNDVTLSAIESSDRLLLVATPEATVARDILESRRIIQDVLRFPADRVSYVLNHPQPYATQRLADFAAATATPWHEVVYGGDAPARAALRGESLLLTKPTNPVARAATAVAQTLSTEAKEQASLR
jgi:CRP-like cAMP-binding protein